MKKTPVRFTLGPADPSRPPEPPGPQPPDILQILEDVKALRRGMVSLAEQIANQSTFIARQIAELTAHLDSRFDAIDAADATIEAELNPAAPFVPPGQIRSTTTMSILSLPATINLTAGGTSDGVQFVDSATPPNIFPGSEITFGPLLGAALPTDVGFTLDADGETFTFVSPPNAVTESASVVATWTDPLGVQAPIVFPTLNINVTGVTPPPPPTVFVPPGQIDEVSGS
jgi:hypothetical protein